MKIYKDETGRIIIDGEKHTFLYPQKGEDWMKVSDDLRKNYSFGYHNFNVIYPSDTLTFGSEIIIENQQCLFIGIQDGKRIFWNTKKNQIVFGYTENEADNIKPVKIRKRFFNWL